MRTSSLLLLLVLLGAVCISTVHAASTLKYAYTYDDDDNDPSTKPFKNPAYVPVYDLGLLEVGWTIQVTINVPNLASSNFLNASIAAGLTLWFLNNTDPTAITYGLARDTDKTSTFKFKAPTTATTSFQGTYTIVFPSGYSGTNSEFKLAFNAKKSFTGPAGSMTKLDYVSIQVEYFKGTRASVGSANPAQTLLKVTETGRQSVVKVIYVAPSSPALQFAFHPFNAKNTSGSEIA